AADDEDAPGAAMCQHRHVDDHLVIDELVGGRRLDDGVQHQHPAEQGILEQHHVLVPGPALVQHPLRPEIDPGIAADAFAEPALPAHTPSPRSSSVISISAGWNACFMTSMQASGRADPHMKTSRAANPRSGQVWIEMWLSASTATPLTPWFGVKWCRWI